ncbi:hypothetical protein CDAR_50431 [Caerostris darwini]|uniref:Uncharacterized protein n=1 Tax=Caerostris darwini TaxID=1538125 RepID=A0AAV4UWT7_9ARAC|nr:hypothetical protein CDAR_50431 [Caerostris darwini]
MWKDDGVEKKRKENYDGEVQAIFALSVANVNANWRRVKRIALWELRANRRLPFATSLAILKVSSTKTPSQIQNSKFCIKLLSANLPKILWIVGRETVPLGDRRSRQVGTELRTTDHDSGHTLVAGGKKRSGILKRSAHLLGYFSRVWIPPRAFARLLFPL